MKTPVPRFTQIMKLWVGCVAVPSCPWSVPPHRHLSPAKGGKGAHVPDAAGSDFQASPEIRPLVGPAQALNWLAPPSSSPLASPVCAVLVLPPPRPQRDRSLLTGISTSSKLSSTRHPGRAFTNTHQTRSFSLLQATPPLIRLQIQSRLPRSCMVWPSPPRCSPNRPPPLRPQLHLPPFHSSETTAPASTSGPAFCIPSELLLPLPPITALRDCPFSQLRPSGLPASVLSEVRSLYDSLPIGPYLVFREFITVHNYSIKALAHLSF